MRKIFLALAMVLLMAQGAMAADSGILRPDHPDRYTVKEGDTLWNIASMFLTDAWHWPDIWQINPDIENPHLIYPGDEIVLSWVDGEPRLSVERGEQARTYKVSPPAGDRELARLEPRIRKEPITSAIPAIPLDAIASLLTTGRIVEQGTLEEAPYILAGETDRLILGPRDRFYARGNWSGENTVYGIFRRGNVYQDPETGDVLGLEARRVGTARMTAEDDDVRTFVMKDVEEDVRIGDRLMVTEERRVESTFYPAAPDDQIRGVVMTILGGLSQVGRNEVVAINRGLDDNLDVGHVLAIHKAGPVVRDRETRELVKLPSERAGVLMVFRAFDKMAYGLILQTEEPIRAGDLVQNP